MYLTQKNQIRGLSKQQFAAIQTLCRLTKNLYNVGLYSVRQFFFAERQYLRYEGNYHTCKGNENYQLLNTDIAQQTLKVVDRSFKSFFKLLKKANQGLYRFEQIRLPKYLKKDGYFPLIMPRIKVKNGYFEIPMSRQFKAEYGTVRIPFPERLSGKKLKETRIVPRHNARWFEVEFVIEQEPRPARVDPRRAMAVDLGLDNLAACVTTDGASFIVDGKKLKSINQGFNRINSKIQSAKDKLGIQGLTNYQSCLFKKRNNRVRDYLNKAARLIVNHCIASGIGTLIVGVNPGWKQSINIGSRNNQNFVSIPHWQLRSKLSSLCERYGIQYIETEESYTSKASALDGDELPVYNADSPKSPPFSGKRIKRGLYCSRDKHIVNSDCNGAWNIGRKSKRFGLFSRSV
ncbi:RNA-guided endonuclease InsQ/TnpB family protein [Capilliphycus salinus ALCB114379]|uniref:RNA-guided endonuclease InsQ/TnpB family protein n=1 Tax=Capilliphycus salinus TaxID=2768948 RepID=UPI0039A65AD0